MSLPNSAAPQPEQVSSRRRFLQAAGVAVAASTLVLAGCNDDDDTPGGNTGTTITRGFGTGDGGVLDYVFRIKQMQAAFYKQVTAAPPSGLPTAELNMLKDIYLHEQIQREYLLAVLVATSAIADDAQETFAGQLNYTFSSFTLTTRTGVLEAARTLEDLSVAAYNGAARLFGSRTLLTALLKMASVDGRHAATVRNLLQAGSYAAADVVPITGSAQGLNTLLTPADALTELNKYVDGVTLLVGSLPTI